MKELFIVFVLACVFYIVIFQELIYYSVVPTVMYEIEVTRKSGAVDIVKVEEPENYYFQVNHYYRLNRYDKYILQGLPESGSLILGGHWVAVCDDVTKFKVVSKQKVEKH